MSRLSPERRARVIEQIDAYANAGVQDIMLTQAPRADREELLRFSREVIPAFR